MEAHGLRPVGLVAATCKETGAAFEYPTLIELCNLRSQRWRYIRYADGTEELYDHNNDEMEWNNLANQPQYTRVKTQMASWLPKVNAPNAPDRKGSRDIPFWHTRYGHLRGRKIEFAE